MSNPIVEYIAKEIRSKYAINKYARNGFPSEPFELEVNDLEKIEAKLEKCKEKVSLADFINYNPLFVFLLVNSFYGNQILMKLMDLDLIKQEKMQVEDFTSSKEAKKIKIAMSVFQFYKLLRDYSKDPIAFYNLGQCYFHGIGTEVDTRKAKEHFERAAFKNYRNGYQMLAFCYYSGKGVEVDKSKAKDIYMIAAEKGCRYSKKILNHLRQMQEHNSNTMITKKTDYSCSCNIL